MKYLKRYHLLESNLIDLRDWEDFKDLVQYEILDEWNIPKSLVKESLPGKSGNSLLEPELHIRINEYFNNLEPVDLVRDCRNLHKQVYQMTGKFISVNWSSQQVNIMLDEVPNHWTILQDFNLQEVESDNTIDKKTGGVCDLETALKILDYLNGFTKFAYDSDIEPLKKCFEVMQRKGDCKIVFSLPTFTKDRFRQKVSFKFCYKENWNANYPIFIIDANHVESPLIRLRISSYNWNEVSGEKKMLDFVENFSYSGG
jgi:hypothetical protein